MVLAATAAARVCSALFNFRVNRQFVFHLNHCKGALPRYAVLVALVLILSATLVTGLSQLLGMGKTVAKALVDSGLFFVNYRIQKAWVFHCAEERKIDA